MIFQSKKQECGAIMLEVIAVLALMGVMGAMLFRQIYLRNQELHNVQMASEMRTVKEAFSAALQARAQEALNACYGVIHSFTQNDVKNGVVKECTSFDAVPYVKEYLPDGWFPDDDPDHNPGGGLRTYYTFHTFVYKQADSSQKVKIYGLVIPKENTLPATGWNFKRAARVSLLIGADGGVYGGVTGHDIQGSLGTWSLADTDLTDDLENPTYVAITGLDIFTPEYDVPETQVNIPNTWDLQLHDLNVYRRFSVGDNTTGCFTDAMIHHSDGRTNAKGVTQVDPDEMVAVSTNCLPSFWVDPNKDGNVFVRNDLNIGYDTTDPTNPQKAAVRITKGGTIIFKDKGGTIIFKDTVNDPQENNNTIKTKKYMLDPAYTSIMNDVKLMSRGGAKLSEILPNYILKDVQDVNVGTTASSITMPTCPQGYSKALVVIPHLAVTGTKSAVTAAGVVASPVVTAVSPETKGTPNINISDNKVVTAVSVPTIQVWSGANCNTASGSNYSKKSTDAQFCIKSNQSVRVTYQTYCVFNKDEFEDLKGDLPTSVRTTDTEPECIALGGQHWDGGSKVCSF